jgi:hypothetical protein
LCRLAARDVELGACLPDLHEWIAPDHRVTEPDLHVDIFRDRPRPPLTCDVGDLPMHVDAPHA